MGSSGINAEYGGVSQYRHNLFYSIQIYQTTAFQKRMKPSSLLFTFLVLLVCSSLLFSTVDAKKKDKKGALNFRASPGDRRDNPEGMDQEIVEKVRKRIEQKPEYKDIIEKHRNGLIPDDDPKYKAMIEDFQRATVKVEMTPLGTEVIEERVLEDWELDDEMRAQLEAEKKRSKKKKKKVKDDQEDIIKRMKDSIEEKMRDVEISEEGVLGRISELQGEHTINEKRTTKEEEKKVAKEEKPSEHQESAAVTVVPQAEEEKEDKKTRREKAIKKAKDEL
eukprot:TRINITY_DN2819_c0_g4_i2.p2 TRINITY_DN2819_c0_g4~~TRINITY_DN2819_c0_g4_i2.p2  ORF type:complete len:278 (-),score=101.28 TRINITY_DN2819_c0_g4_i2:70-903(-)